MTLFSTEVNPSRYRILIHKPPQEPHKLLVGSIETRSLALTNNGSSIGAPADIKLWRQMRDEHVNGGKALSTLTVPRAAVFAPSQDQAAVPEWARGKKRAVAEREVTDAEVAEVVGDDD